MWTKKHDKELRGAWNFQSEEVSINGQSSETIRCDAVANLPISAGCLGIKTPIGEKKEEYKCNMYVTDTREGIPQDLIRFESGVKA